MTAPIALRPGRTLPLVALVLGLLSACAAGPFKAQLEVPNPANVGAVYVLLGQDSDFASKPAKGDEVERLILPSRLKEYVGYAEYELEATSSVANWHELGRQLPAHVELTPPVEGVSAMKLKLNRRLLKLHPQLALAVIVRNSEHEYLMRSWPSTVVAEAKGTLLVNVSADGVAGVAN